MTSLDCVDGYHGVELDKIDRHKMTFATEWGLFSATCILFFGKLLYKAHASYYGHVSRKTS